MTDLNKVLIDMTLLTSIVGKNKSGLDAAFDGDPFKKCKGCDKDFVDCEFVPANCGVK